MFCGATPQKAGHGRLVKNTYTIQIACIWYIGPNSLSLWATAGYIRYPAGLSQCPYHC
jgi:hypothetical protein